MKKIACFSAEGQPVKTALPEGLLGKTNLQKKETVPVFVPEVEKKKKPGEKAVLENKLYEIGDKSVDIGQAKVNIAGICA